MSLFQFVSNSEDEDMVRYKIHVYCMSIIVVKFYWCYTYINFDSSFELHNINLEYNLYFTDLFL